MNEFKTNWILKSKNIERAYNEHLSETAASGSGVTASDAIKELMALPYPHATREIATFYQLNKGDNNVIVPIMNTVTTSTLTSGDFGAIGNAVVSFATITVNQEYGTNFQWDRLFAERAKWDVMGPFVSDALYAIEDKLMATLCSTLSSAAGSVFGAGATVTWSKLVDGRTSLAAQNFNCDKVIVDPIQYGELLKIQQVVDASYFGTDTNIRTGKIQTVLGFDIIQSKKCAATDVLFVDSKYAAGVGVLRDGKVEEYSYPDTNKYGVVVSEYFGVKVLNTLAVAKGTIGA